MITEGKTILILDDEASIRQSFTDYFEDRLWECIQAESGEEALNILDSKIPDAAIVDIRLPGMSGDEFIREAMHKSRSIAFAICTGSPDFFIPKELLAQENISDEIFSKPVSNIERIEEKLKKLISMING